MPLRFVWGAQKGGTTGLWDMLHMHLACGANKRFGMPLAVTYPEEKESHYLVVGRKIPSRVAYMETYLLTQCESHCFVDATPDNLIVPFAAARLYSIMSSAEAVRSRRRPCTTAVACPATSNQHPRPGAPLLVNRRVRALWCRCENPSLAMSPSSRWRVGPASPTCQLSR
jgi:hypothetical protein